MSLHDPYRELFERSADCFLILEKQEFVDCNAAAIKLFGAADRSEMLSIHPSELSPPTQPDGRESFEKANEMIAIAIANGSHRFEWDHRRIDGSVFQAEVLLTTLNVPGRDIVHSVVRDVSPRKRLEAELRHAQKMEAVGKLAGGIAHDFNNLLVVMLGGCDMLDQLELSELGHRYVHEIREAGERGAGLIRQLLTFSRKQEVPEEKLDLAGLVGNMMYMLERLVGDHIELRLETEGPAVVLANRHRLEQMLLNLVTNAADAMPDGGLLEVEVVADHSSTLGDCVVLHVRDTGTGMDPETLERAFEPFYTSKPLGYGTGLGLATVKNIVDQTGGEVSISSVPNRGTQVTVGLEQIKDQSEPRSNQNSAAGDGTILVVEDDPAIRRMLEYLLSSSGFAVLSAENGEAGLAQYAEHSAEIDLVMTDVVMPKLGGPDMVLRLRDAGHRVPVVFMSGYTDASLTKLAGLHEEIDVIEKPFNLPTLVARIRRVLHVSSGDS